MSGGAQGGGGGAGSILLTAGLAAGAIAVGLAVLPYANPAAGFADFWDAICSAAGVPARRGTPSEAAAGGSRVVVVSGMLDRPPADAVGRGATIAQQCAICHGPGGVSESQFPNLAGQYASAVYKELRDFKSGARSNAVMTPFAQPLSERDMADVASYYASLPPQPATAAAAAVPAPAIVANGAPLRGIAPCGACHGGLEVKAGSPWLNGQPEAYVLAQLEAFATGARGNDIGGQMRNIARRMTRDEMAAAARHFSAQAAALPRAAE